MNQTDVAEIRTKLAEIATMGRSLAEQLSQVINEPFIGGPRRGMKMMCVNNIWIPNEIGIAKIQTDPRIFTLQNIQAFWSLYEQAVLIIDKPIVQIPGRTALEVVYSRIIAQAICSLTEQKIVAAKYWLCIIGLLYPNHPFASAEVVDRGALYEALVEIIQKDNSVSDFKNRIGKRDEIFFQKKMHEIFPKLTNAKTCETVTLYIQKFLNVSSPDASRLEMQYRSMSQYVHGNPVSLALFDSDRKNFGHVTRMGKLFSQAGLVMISYNQFLLKAESYDSTNIKILEKEIDGLLLAHHSKI